MSNPFSDPKNSLTIHISTLSIVKVLVVLLALAFLYLVWGVVVLLFVSLLLAAALSPAIDWLTRRHLPRSVSVLLIYAIVLSVLSIILVLLAPPVARELADLARTFPDYYGRLRQWLGNGAGHGAWAGALQQAIGGVGQTLSRAGGSVVGAAAGLFGGLFSFLTVLVLTFYFSVEKNGLKSLAAAVTPAKHQKYVAVVISRIQDKLGLWLRGQLLLSAIIFVMILAGLLILRAPYALVLALMAGLFEAVPFVGPIAAAVPAVLLALTVSPLKALLVAGLYIVVQQLENNIIVPKVMQKTVGLNPVVVIIAVLLGAKLSGILGAILAIPVATAAMVVIGDWWGGEESDN